MRHHRKRWIVLGVFFIGCISAFAAGRKLPELDGLQNVEIEKITAQGITIFHKNGVKILTEENLSETGKSLLKDELTELRRLQKKAKERKEALRKKHSEYVTAALADAQKESSALKALAILTAAEKYNLATQYDQLLRAIELKQQQVSEEQKSVIPKEGLVFHAPLNDAARPVALGKLVQSFGKVRYYTQDEVECAYFDGNTMLIFGRNNFATQKQVCTMSIWVYSTSESNSREIAFCIGRQTPLAKRALIRHNGRMKFEGFHASVTTSFPLSQKWVCYVMTFDGNYVRLYADGKLVGRGPADLNTAQDCIAIGGIPENGRIVEPWTGYLCDARIYNRVLSLSEIAQLSGH